jgi:nucleoside-diphosphate-sugar epimerase
MMQARLAVTSAKAEQELGWKHRPLRETLADEVAWYRSERIASEPNANATATAA